jgi:DNA-binding winged helix-turn-helix (wHTH) protein
MRYEFGGYVLDTERRELIGGEGAIPIRPKVFALLAYLIANRDRVVPKQEVFDRLWAGVQVGDATLNTCIKAARQAIGDSGQRQVAIRTWHGVGYRFVVPVWESSGLAAGSGAPAERPAPLPDAAAPAGPPAGKEHKQVSVLDGVVHEAARLAAGLGPEAMHEAMERWMDMAQSIVQAYGGSVTQWSSDGFVALFGAPRAYEDHARRAVTAALDLQRATAAAQADARPLLPLRIALHTGPVVVGTSAGQLYSAVGETTQTARVLQQAGPPDAVVASAATYGIVADEVAAEPLRHEAAAGAHIIRSLVVRRSGVPNRGRQALSRFVGRDQELAILLDRVALLNTAS